MIYTEGYVLMPFLLKQIWDMHTKRCVKTLEGHANRVTAVCSHPELPILMTGSQDGTVRLWNSYTFR